MGSKVLVTGGSGFLGSHIADSLSENGYEVTILDLHPPKTKRDDQVFLKGDITDFEFIKEATKGFDYIYHLAALADLNAAKTRPLDTVIINIQGTVNLLEASRLNGIKRFVFGSTVYVYSREGGFYRCSKQACENYVEEYFNKFGLAYTVLRFGSLYGPRADMTNGVYRLLKDFIEKDEMAYSGSSTDKRDYIHVYDAAKLSVKILEQEFENKHVVLTGNDKFLVSEIFKMFEEILGKKVNVRYLGDEGQGNGHYNLTPYTFTPKIGKKLISDSFVDIGQGIIQVIEQINDEKQTFSL